LLTIVYFEAVQKYPKDGWLYIRSTMRLAFANLPKIIAQSIPRQAMFIRILGIETLIDKVDS